MNLATATENNFSVIILAAGLGKRMQNPEIPKVLATVNKKPLIFYVLQTAISLNPEKICLIVGHKKEQVIDYVANKFFNDCDDNSKKFLLENIVFAVQEQQLGTGHAVQCAEHFFSKNNDCENINSNEKSQNEILILSGDVPLLSEKTLSDFIQFHKKECADISVLSAEAVAPFGYGRIVRNSNNEFVEIVEEKDATVEIKKVCEINSGIYFLKSDLLFDLLNKINNQNSQNEFYLTDIIKIGKSQNKKVIASKIATIDEIQGINTVDQLNQLRIKN